ncbi:MAG: hypothetical protein GF372_05035 [Candidatus Marinimicrobia bacterium]|nr:hypothetical protein [Candidatus Neomarinimicrobiota bacterium]
MICILALLLTATVLADDPNYPSMDVSTIQGLDEITGYFGKVPYGAASDERWMNVEDRYAGSYEYWAAIRFDLTGVRDQLNTAFGAGNWKVTKVVLSLWETEVWWMAPGTVEIRWTEDDTTNITYETPKSTLILNLPPDDPINGQFVNDTIDPSGTHIREFPFSAQSGYNRVDHVLYDENDPSTHSDGALYTADDITLDDQVTFAMVDALDGVKAGYVGYKNSYTNEHPFLTITAEATGHVANCLNKPVYDFDDDCQVTIADYVMFASGWLECGYEDPADCQ